MSAPEALPVPGSPAFAADWLALREDADAAARADELVGPLAALLVDRPEDGPLVVRDLGCGTGSMGRWLAGRLPGPQHWILCDRDAELLAIAAASLPPSVTTGCEQRDVTRLQAADLAGTSLVTASALLDLLTEDEIARLAGACAAAGCPALLTLSVTGHIEMSPPDPLDTAIAAAFDAHQRRTPEGSTARLLGPDAADAAAAAFRRAGMAVRRSPSPWRLGPDQSALAAQWLRGWVAAAMEQRPDLDAGGYLRRRLAACAAGELRIVVGHADLLALPAGGAR